jgi:hypothetical protein
MRPRLPPPRAFASSSAFGLLAIAAATHACGGSESAPNRDPVADQRSPVINGADDRQELPTLTPPGARETIAHSVAALMWINRIDYDDPGALRAVSLAEGLGVCEDERFAQQPTAAFCSGTLLDGDLLLTAGHCLGQDADDAAESCRHLLVVFDYHLLDSGALALSSGDSVYSCRKVAYHQKATVDDGLVDLAVVQLDRPVSSPLAPAMLAEADLELGMPLIAASHGAGLPLKVDRGAVVVDVPAAAEYFIASTDSFGGGSGGPLFDASLRLVGHQLRGLPDWQRVGDCLRAAYAPAAGEEHQRIETSVRAFCGSGWPSERLCGIAPSCGDKVCDASERAGQCPNDCPAPRCGDGRCDVFERGDCAADCSPFDDVPLDWLDDPADFAAGQAPASTTSAADRTGCALTSPVPRGTPTGWLTSLIFALLGLRTRTRRRRSAWDDRHAR